MLHRATRAPKGDQIRRNLHGIPWATLGPLENPLGPGGPECPLIKSFPSTVRSHPGSSGTHPKAHMGSWEGCVPREDHPCIREWVVRHPGPHGPKFEPKSLGWVGHCLFPHQAPYCREWRLLSHRLTFETPYGKMASPRVSGSTTFAKEYDLKCAFFTFLED